MEFARRILELSCANAVSLHKIGVNNHSLVFELLMIGSHCGFYNAFLWMKEAIVSEEQKMFCSLYFDRSKRMFEWIHRFCTLVNRDLRIVFKWIPFFLQQKCQVHYFRGYWKYTKQRFTHIRPSVFWERHCMLADKLLEGVEVLNVFFVLSHTTAPQL